MDAAKKPRRFNRPAWAAARPDLAALQSRGESDEPFNRRKETLALLAQQQQQQQRKLDVAERRKQGSPDMHDGHGGEQERGAKRRRLSTDRDDCSSDVDGERRTTSAAENHHTWVAALDVFSEIKSSQTHHRTGSALADAAPALHSNGAMHSPSDKTEPVREPEVIALSDDDDDDDDNPAPPVHPRPQASAHAEIDELPSRPPPHAADEALTHRLEDDLDEDLYSKPDPALLETAATLSASSHAHHTTAPGGGADDNQNQPHEGVIPPNPPRPRTPVARPVDAARQAQLDKPVHLLVHAPGIPGTEPLLAIRRLGQRLREVRLAWLERQQRREAIASAAASTVFLTWRGQRVYDFNTCANLGVRVDYLGGVWWKGREVAAAAAAGDEGAQIELVAVTPEIFERDFGRDGHRDGPTANETPAIKGTFETADASPEKQQDQATLKLIVRAAGKVYREYKALVRPTTKFRQIALAFRRRNAIPDARDVYLTFDGRRLGPDEDVASLEDVEQGDYLDAVVKEEEAT